MPQKLQNIGKSMDNVAKEAAAVSTGRVALSGHYAIAMFKDAAHAYYLTAVGGGGRTTDTLHTDATAVQDWEKFRFIGGGPAEPFAIQTINGHFLTAVDGGGHTTNAITTATSQVSSWELFHLRPQSGSGFSPHFSIQTAKGTFLTAVGHGGQNTPDAIHSDATAAKDWEMFDLLKIGDPGTNRTYSLEALSFSGASLGYLNATDGGRHSDGAALTLQPGPSYMLSFTLVQQPDGTYAFKTASGYYVTANAAGLAGARFRTDTPQVNNWEKFTVIPDENDCTYRIKANSGAYVTVAIGHPPDPQYVVDCAPVIADAIRWRLWVASF